MTDIKWTPDLIKAIQEASQGPVVIGPDLTKSQPVPMRPAEEYKGDTDPPGYDPDRRKRSSWQTQEKCNFEDPVTHKKCALNLYVQRILPQKFIWDEAGVSGQLEYDFEHPSYFLVCARHTGKIEVPWKK